MKIMLLAAMAAAVAAPAYAGDVALTGGKMTITDTDGESFEGTTVGIVASTALLSAKTDSGIGIELRAKGGVEAVDLGETRFSYSYEDEGEGEFEVFRGFDVDGRAHAALEIGLEWNGFRLAAATGFQVAHVGELWEVDGPGVKDDYRSAHRTYGAGSINEITFGYSNGGLAIGAFYQEGDLTLSESEFEGAWSSTGDYGLENENYGGFVSVRFRS